MTLTAIKWTLEDYHAMIAAGILSDRHVELLEGIIVEMSPEGTPHTYFSDRLANELRTTLIGRAQVREARPITLSDASEPEPDIALVAPLDDVYLDHHPYPENIFLLIEYSDSSLSKDLEIKSKIYARAGIQDYWVVDLKHQRLIVFRDPDLGEYQTRNTLITGTIAPLMFSDITLQVTRLMRR